MSTFANNFKVEHVNAVGQVVKKSQNLVNVVCERPLSEIAKLPNGIIDMGSLCTLSLKVHLEIHVVRLTPTSATSHFKT